MGLESGRESTATVSMITRLRTGLLCPYTLLSCRMMMTSHDMMWLNGWGFSVSHVCFVYKKFRLAVQIKGNFNLWQR
jgi:hypothetical protein